MGMGMVLVLGKVGDVVRVCDLRVLFIEIQCKAV